MVERRIKRPVSNMLLGMLIESAVRIFAESTGVTIIRDPDEASHRIGRTSVTDMSVSKTLVAMRGRLGPDETPFPRHLYCELSGLIRPLGLRSIWQQQTVLVAGSPAPHVAVHDCTRDANAPPSPWNLRPISASSH